MNEKLYNEICSSCSPFVTGEQLLQIRKAVASVISQYEVITSADARENARQSNQQLLDAFVSAKRVEGCSKRTIDAYCQYLSLFMRYCIVGLGDVTTNDIRLFLAHLQTDRANSNVSVDNHRRVLSSFFKWLEDESYIKKSPVKRIHKIKQMKVVKEAFSEEELEIIRSNCKCKRELAIVDFLASTGVRIGELEKLNKSDIDFEKRQCVVLGKGNKQRIVYFSTRAKIHLQNYLDERSDDSEALFVSSNAPHARLKTNGYETWMRHLGKKLGFKIHPHRFRRTLATRALERGMPIEQVQHLLGHSKLDTTLIYVTVQDSNVEHSHRKFID